MILHQIEALADAGVTDVVLAVNYRPEVMEGRLAEVREPWKRTGRFRTWRTIRVEPTSLTYPLLDF